MLKLIHSFIHVPTEIYSVVWVPAWLNILLKIIKRKNTIYLKSSLVKKSSDVNQTTAMSLHVLSYDLTFFLGQIPCYYPPRLRILVANSDGGSPSILGMVWTSGPWMTSVWASTCLTLYICTCIIWLMLGTNWLWHKGVYLIATAKRWRVSGKSYLFLGD